MHHRQEEFIVLTMLLIFISAIMMQILINKPNKAEIRTKAAAGILTVCPDAGGGCTYSGAVGIQQAIDAATDGDTVFIKNGTYSRPDSVPWTFPPEFFRRTSDKCFLNLKGKSLTLKGENNWNTRLFGEGHSPNAADIEPYASRIGICTAGGSPTIDNLHLKEFQNGCGHFINANITVKNSWIEGCDMGGFQLRGTTQGLFVNNYFVSLMNAGALGLWEKAYAKTINNTFDNSQMMFYIHPSSVEPPTITFTNNILDVDDTSPVNAVEWAGWIDKRSEIAKSTFTYNLIWLHGKICDPGRGYCDNFLGKIENDPLFEDHFVGQGGLDIGSLELKPGSPAIGTGDPSIPGTRDMGAKGGPCLDGNSPLCLDFIDRNRVRVSSPTPTVPKSPTPDQNSSPTPFRNPSPTAGIIASPTPSGPTPTVNPLITPSVTPIPPSPTLTPILPSFTPTPTPCAPNWCFIEQSECCFDPICMVMGKVTGDPNLRCGVPEDYSIAKTPRQSWFEELKNLFKAIF